MRFRAAPIALAVLTLALGAVPPAAGKGNDDKPHTWTVVLVRGRVQNASSNPDDDCPFPVFRKGRGDRIQFVSRDDRYWVRFRTPSPLRLKGEVVQSLEVFAFGSRPTPIYTFTTDAPADTVDWERFPFEVHGAQDMPKDAADQPRETHTGKRPKPPTLKELQKQKLEVDLVIDGVK